MLSRKRWARHWKNKSVLVRSDNVSVVQCINRQGGGETISPLLCQFALKLWQLGIENQIVLRAAHIAGVRNDLADHLRPLTESQDLSHREWSLKETVVQRILLSTSNRSVCISTEPQTASLLLLAYGPTGMGYGQPVNILGGDPGVCIPPNCVNFQNTGLCIQIQLQSTVSCSEVAKQTKVHWDPQFVVRHAVINSSSPRPTEDDWNRHISARSRVFEIGNLANFGSRSRPSGISEPAGKLMLAAWRRGTQNAYSSQYRIFGTGD